MTSPARVFAILDLFTREHPVWDTDAIIEATGYTRATGYRYVKELVDAGFLQKVATGAYALGGRIIELDFQLRQTDPVLLAAMPAMERAAEETGFDIVLSVLFAGPKIIDIHRVNREKKLELAFGRGRPRPIFRSGAPKVLLAGLPRTQLLKLYEANPQEVADNGMGTSWAEFRAQLTAIRKQGYYYSIGELEPRIGAMAAPVHGADGEVLAAIAIVGSERHLKQASEEQLWSWLQATVRRVEKALVSPPAPKSLKG